jgi:hypothetical protein
VLESGEQAQHVVGSEASHTAGRMRNGSWNRCHARGTERKAARVTIGERARGLTWLAVSAELQCTPSRLTGLRTATSTDMELAMRITQWLGLPAARFIHPAHW